MNIPTFAFTELNKKTYASEEVESSMRKVDCESWNFPFPFLTLGISLIVGFSSICTDRRRDGRRMFNIIVNCCFCFDGTYDQHETKRPVKTVLGNDLRL